MKRKILYVVMILGFLSVGVYGGCQIFKELSEYQESENAYTDLEEYVQVPEAPDIITSDNTDSSESGELPVEQMNWPVVDFEALQEVNEDCVAWILIEGTEINYPVVQGKDNSYYLKHLFEGTWNSSGCIFLDSRVEADLSDRHSIIYGHHMKNGTMFSGLTQYKKQEYYDTHPTAFLITPDANYQIEFFAGYVANVKDDAWKLVFESEEDYGNWTDAVMEKSWFESQVSPTETDRIITLSTCSYEFDNARFVIHGVLR